jgi:hypothetical protein
LERLDRVVATSLGRELRATLIEKPSLLYREIDHYLTQHLCLKSLYHSHQALALVIKLKLTQKTVSTVFLLFLRNR